MGCCEGCGRVLLVCINLFFALIGAVLFGGACVVRFGSDLLDPYLQDAFDAFQNALPDDLDLSNLNIGDLLGDVSIAFIVIGLFFFLLGIFGCVGACCKVRCLLIVYSIVVIVIFVAEVVFVILLFTIRSKLDGWIQEPLVEKLTDDYTGSNGTDAFSLALNFVMHEFDCCGIENYKDFENATKWPHVVQYNNNTYNLEVPVICCRNRSDYACAQSPSANNSFISQGCYAAVDSWLTENNDVLIGVGAGVAGVQLLLIIIAIAVCCGDRDRYDDDDSYSEHIPIHPYREPREPYTDPRYPGGHKGPYSESPPTHRSHMDPYDGYGGKRSHADYPGPYRGRTDPYTGPPAEYRHPGDDRRSYQEYR